MSEDKLGEKSVKKLQFYFFKGLKPGVIFDPKKDKVMIQVNERKLFVTKREKVAELLREKGYEELSEEMIKKL